KKMKISISKENLLRGIQAVQNAVSNKSTLPILSHILLESRKNELTLTATDLEIGVSIKVESDVSEEGAVTVPARKFSEIIKELHPQNPIHLSVKKNQSIQIDSGKSYFRLMGLLKDEFPQLPEFPSQGSKNADWVKLSQKTLKNMIQLTSFAMSHDESRYVLNGILFSFKDKGLKLVATDGRRLAIIEKAMEEIGSFKKDVIIPMKTTQELSRNLGEEGDVMFCFKENQVQMGLGSLFITSRLIEGEYPNYEQVIPKKTKEELKINTQDFLQAARRASILTSQDSQSIKINFIKDRMIITKNTPDVGEAHEELEVDYKGGEFAIGFNPIFLIDVLKNIDAENIHLGLTDPEKPAIIRNGRDYTYIVLPMQVT
ncbi:MAG: DNA polymerase III subunit beta, partial [Candidatus Omnitrophica bacterium]|nr:DNA polymerase III subunit beta [Candidatus Omnitrophota bacterium]